MLRVRFPPLASPCRERCDMDELTQRWCRRCQSYKPLDQFSPRTRGGLQGYCKPCPRAYKQENYRKNRDKFLARALANKAQRREIFRAAKSGSCADCGNYYPPYVMDFDHREGETKLFNVSAWNVQRWVSIAMLRAEIAKCDLVCANCHRERTHQRRCRKAAADAAKSP
jgi:hypothetical protein